MIMVIHGTCFILILCFVYLQPHAVYLYVFSIVFFFFFFFVIFGFVYLQLDAV